MTTEISTAVYPHDLPYEVRTLPNGATLRLLPVHPVTGERVITPNWVADMGGDARQFVRSLVEHITKEATK